MNIFDILDIRYTRHFLRDHLPRAGACILSHWRGSFLVVVVVDVVMHSLFLLLLFWMRFESCIKIYIINTMTGPGRGAEGKCRVYKTATNSLTKNLCMSIVVDVLFVVVLFLFLWCCFLCYRFWDLNSPVRVFLELLVFFSFVVVA